MTRDILEIIKTCRLCEAAAVGIQCVVTSLPCRVGEAGWVDPLSATSISRGTPALMTSCAIQGGFLSLAGSQYPRLPNRLKNLNFSQSLSHRQGLSSRPLEPLRFLMFRPLCPHSPTAAFRRPFPPRKRNHIVCPLSFLC